MPKIVSYKPQNAPTENEIDIADQGPPTINIESYSDMVTYNKLLGGKSKTPLPIIPKRMTRSSSQIRKNDSKRSKPKVPYNTELDVCRISMPCNTGCCYCTYANKLGPVKIFVSSFEPEKDRLIGDIKDGRGKKVIPTSRKGDLKGLVFDKETFSFHPPCTLGKNGFVRGYKKR